MGETRWVALVLAAGKGTRMKSELAKVLHEIEGKTLLAHVLETAARLPLRRTIIVIGHQAEEVRLRHQAYGVETALQVPQLGTGHAVMVAAPLLREEPELTSLLVLYGDVPLLRETTLAELMERHVLDGNGVTVLTACLPDPSGYGRIIRDDAGNFNSIVEDRDLASNQRSVSEVNSGIYAFQLKPLLESLQKLRPDNSQKEYYLTDTLGLLQEEGFRIGVVRLQDSEEISGINTVAQLEEAAGVLDRRRREGGGCPICEMLGGGRPERILEEGALAAALLSPRPYNSGHVWIVPRRHLVSFESLSAEESSAILTLGQKAERWCEAAYHPQAFNLGYNSGRPGDHLVLHVIPRWSGDSNFMPLIGGVNLLPETLEDSRRRLLQARADSSGLLEGS